MQIDVARPCPETGSGSEPTVRRVEADGGHVADAPKVAPGHIHGSAESASGATLDGGRIRCTVAASHPQSLPGVPATPAAIRTNLGAPGSRAVRGRCTR